MSESLYRLPLQVAFLRVRVFAGADAGRIQRFLFESVAVRARVFGYVCISAKGFVRGLCCHARLSGKLCASGVCAQERPHALEQHLSLHLRVGHLSLASSLALSFLFHLSSLFHPRPPLSSLPVILCARACMRTWTTPGGWFCGKPLRAPHHGAVC